MPTTVTILGATGSIGRSALDVARSHPGRFRVAGLAARTNIDLLVRHIDEFRPDCVAVGDLAAARELRERRPGVEVLPGPEGVEEIAARRVDVVLCGMVGAAGLRSVLSAIRAGNRVALANKEPMVMAGELIMREAARAGVTVLPVDSEHSAIFQCIEGRELDEVHRVYLTASGGPFYGRTHESLMDVTPEEAVRHPTWDMGQKISVDSATLMNKGLEVIEAMRLFGFPLDRIEVIIHPQSIMHGFVEFVDGNFLAQLGPTDMRLPIQFALTWPERVQSPVGRLELTSLKGITFAAPDFSEFPCLGLALDAARQGGTAPTVLNAANEVAVEAFCKRSMAFPRIAEVVEGVLEHGGFTQADALETILAADEEARRRAREFVLQLGAPL
jgi:1-deoxy-D-xylulose-5-phosphate reductoisomerase